MRCLLIAWLALVLLLTACERARPTATPDARPTPSVVSSLTPAPTIPADPLARLEAAHDAERIGDWPHALALYGTLRTDQALGARALLALGDLLLRDQRPLEAAATWQELLTRFPDAPEANGARYRMARGLAAVGEYGRAIELFQQVAQHAESEGLIEDLLTLRLADAYAANGQEDLAAAERERLYDTRGANRIWRATAARALGEYHAANQRWPQAERWFERALSLSRVESYRAELTVLLARAAEGQGDRPAALERWQEVVDEYASTPSALSAATAMAGLGQPLDDETQGRILLANGQGRAAARHFFDALEAEDRAILHDWAAQALLQAGDRDGAIRQWQSLIETHPEAADQHDDALLAIGRAQRAAGQRPDALARFDELLERYPDGSAAADAMWEAATLRADAASYQRFAERYPDDERAADALFRAGLLRYPTTPEQAERLFQRVAELPDQDQPARAPFWAGKAALAAEDRAGAAAHWRQAVAVGGADYYALRAAYLLGDADGWQPREQHWLEVNPPPEADWLDGVSEGDGQDEVIALLGDRSFLRGDRFLNLGEEELARAAYGESIERYREKPIALWLLAAAFQEREMPSLSSRAARALMTLLDYDIATAPPDLLALAYPLPYPDLLNEQATQQGVSPTLLAALVRQESQWEATARSSAAARGLTQVIPDTGTWIAGRLGDDSYRYRDLDRPNVALRYGAFYLDATLDEFDDNPYAALAAYNAGPGNARRWLTRDNDLMLEQVTFPETRLYIELVYEHWYAYHRLAMLSR